MVARRLVTWQDSYFVSMATTEAAKKNPKHRVSRFLVSWGLKGSCVLRTWASRARRAEVGCEGRGGLQRSWLACLTEWRSYCQGFWLAVKTRPNVNFVIIFSFLNYIAALTSHMYHVNRPEAFSTVFIFLVIKKKTVKFSNKLLQPLLKKIIYAPNFSCCSVAKWLIAERKANVHVVSVFSAKRRRFSQQVMIWRWENEKWLTCSARGFQRMFFSSAGAELSVLCGRFLRVSDTTPLSARSRPTRLRSCQPTYWGQRGRRLRRDNLTCWASMSQTSGSV